MSGEAEHCNRVQEFDRTEEVVNLSLQELKASMEATVVATAPMMEPKMKDDASNRL